jgi:transcriptional regulator with XRE-family HTH domain
MPVMEPEDSRSEGLGRAIRVIRTGHDMSRKDLAERSGLSYSYLAEIESGAKSPSSKSLVQIAQALGVAVHELMEAAERWEHTPPPHSYEELRDSSRTRTRGDRSARTYRAMRGSLARTFSGRMAPDPAVEGLREATVRSALDEATEGSASRLRGASDADTSEDDVRELLALVAELGPEDRERLLDLARRLAEAD